MFRKLINFYKDYDIRWKLKKISKLTRINIYPLQFKFNFINKIHSSIIFDLIFLNKILDKRKNLYNFIKLMSEYKTNNINFLISPQSSGSNFLRQCINSYFEISNNLGNGIPFHDKLKDRWMNSGPAIIFGDMWRSVNFDRNIHFEKLDKKIKKNFFSQRVVFTRHPLMKCDLFNLDNQNINPLILIRNPNDWILSRYIYLINNRYYKQFNNGTDGINFKIINDELSRLNFFFKYWIENIKMKKQFLILDYKDLVNDTHNTIFKVLDFFKYENIDNEIIKKSAEYNSTDFIKNFYKTDDMLRFTNQDQKKIIKNKIENFVNDIVKEKQLNENFNELLNIKKTSSNP